MEENIEILIKNICDKEDYNNLLKDIVKTGKANKINCILEDINIDNTIEKKKKTELYEKTFDYVIEINNELKMQIKRIFEKGVRAGIKEFYNIEVKKENMEKIRIVIADDNKGICDLIKKYLEKYPEVEILGIANCDDEEIEMIENLKPEVVITDLVRNHKYTGLDIIKRYYNKSNGPEFLVISADDEKDIIKDGLKVAGYIKKQLSFDYDIIYRELIKIKNNIRNKK